ncbi:MAG: hypothetical protein AB1552_00570 [Nitrospirota bacterium]
MGKAIALLSGGLDSTLAILIMRRQGIGIEAIKFLTPFDCAVSDGASPLRDPSAVAAKYDFHVRTCRLGEQFIEMVRNPSHGYGKNMNPCIDCRILMLREAKELLAEVEADFIVTGEVLGQRPMSQRKEILYHIDKEAGVPGLVMRPLSAHLLKITLPEARGVVDREKLYGFSGRSRKPQMALAEEFGLTDYPAPAGGCLLTEQNYARKLRDLLLHSPFPARREIDLLRTGRHFRFSPECKIIVGRDATENSVIESLSSDHDCIMKVEAAGSPTTLVTGKLSDEALKTAAGICARYSDAKHLPEVEVTITKEGMTVRMKVSPAGRETLERLRIS